MRFLQKNTLLLAAASVFAASSALAATETWDTTATAGIQAGAGTWNLANTLWTSDGGTSNIGWTNGNDAIFTGGANTVTVGTDVLTAGVITVSGTAETVWQGALNNLTFTTVNIGTTGAGKLSIKGNTASPGSTITGGTINIANGATLYAAANSVVPSIGSAITVQGTGNSENRGAIRLDGGATLTGSVTLAGNATIGGSSGVVSGVISDGGSGFSLTTAATGFVSLELGGNNTYSGGTNIGGGTIRLSNAGSVNALGTGTVTFTGSATLANGTSSAASIKNIGNAIVINTGATASFDGGWNSLALAGNISGAGAFTKASSGNVFLSGTNSYTGATTVSAGNLWFMNAGSLSSGTTITAGATAAVVATGAQTTVMGWLNSGKIATGSAGAIALNNNSAEAIDFATGGFNSLGLSSVRDVTFSGTINAGTGGYRFGHTGGAVEGNLNVATNLGGAFALTKSGTSLLTLSGANTYTGATSITAGTTFLSGSIANTGGVTVSGGTLALVGSGTLAGAGAVTVGAGSLVTYSVNAIGSAGSTIALTNAASTLVYTGAAETTDRVINFNSASSGGFITANGTGTLTFSQAATTAGTTADFGITLNGVGSGSFTGLTAPGAFAVNFNKQGTGIWTLTGATNLHQNATNGAFKVDGGILRFASTSSTGSGTDAAAITRNNANGGVLKIVSGAQVYTKTANTNGILGGWATVDDTTWAVTNGTGAILTGLSTFDTSNTWVAAANADIGASNTAGTDTSVNSLRFNTAGALTQTLAGANVVTSGGILVTSAVGANDVTITGGTSLAAGVTNGDIIVHQNNAGGKLVINSVILANGSGGLTKAGVGTLDLGGINTYTGTTFVNEGTLNLNNGGGAGVIRGALTIANGATVNVNVANAFGTAQFTRVGNITINGGTLNINNTGANSVTSAGITMTGGTLTGMAGSKLDLLNNGAGDVSITTNAAATTATISLPTLNLSTTGPVVTVAKGYTSSGIDLLISSVITGTRSLTKAGLGTLKLTGTNTYSGGTFVNAGTLEVGSQGATGGKATLNGGRLVVTAGVTYSVDNGLTFASGQNAILAAASGTATIRGNDINSADVIVNAGVVAAIDSTITVSTQGFGFRFDTAGDIGVAGAITGTGSANNALGMTGLYVGTDSGALYKLGTGTLTLTGASTFTAGSNVAATLVQNGTLKLSGGDNRLPAGSAVYLGIGTTSGVLALDGINQSVTGLKDVGTGTGNAVVGASATLSRLTVNNTNNYAFGGTLGGAGTNNNNLALTKSGSGTLTLSGANTYSGGTTIGAGTLVAAHASAFGTGTVSLSGGALQTTVANVGSGALTMNNVASTLALNGSGAGALTVSGANNVSLTAGTWLIQNLSLGSLDQIAGGTGSLTLTGITLDLGGDIFTAGNSFTLITGFSGGKTIGSVNITNYNSGSVLASLDASGTLSFTAVPEPSTYGLLGAGALAGVALVRRRRKVA